MAIPMGTPKPTKKDIEDLYAEASASVAAQTLLDAMTPQIERAFATRLRALFDAAPELGALLDARAQLKAIWDFKVGLSNDAKRGKAAVDVFNELLAKSA